MDGGRADEIPGLVPLAAERPLDDIERALLERLVEAAGDVDLARQLSSVRVDRACSCGCPSVGLTADGPVLSSASMRSLSPDRRTDWAEVCAWGTDDDGREIQVNLHVIDGLLHELEIWSGWDGSDPVPSLPHADTLSIDH